MFADIDRDLKPWHVIGALALALVLGYYLVGVSGPRLEEYSGGLEIFDMRMAGYTENDAVTLLAALGPEGNSYYRGSQLFDIFFPPAWFLATAFVVIWFSRPGRAFSAPMVEGVRLVIITVAAFAFLLDWGENIIVFIMLMGDGHPNPTLVELGSTVTYMKGIAYLVSFAGLVLTLVLAFLHWAAFSPARA